MKFLNLNTLNNALNFLIVVISALAVQDIWSGILGPVLALKVVGSLSTIKIVLNMIRDGITGLVKVQPPVK